MKRIPWKWLTMIGAIIMLSDATLSRAEQQQVLHRRPPMVSFAEEPVTSEEDVSQSLTHDVEETSVRQLPRMIIEDLNLTEAVEVSTALRMLGQIADINMMISPGVTDRIELAFRKIAWNEAFESVLDAAGLTYRWQGNILRVMTIDDLRRELELNRVLRDSESIREDMRLVEPLVMAVIPLRFVSVETMSSTLARVLGVVEGRPAGRAGRTSETASTQGVMGRGSVSMDPESNAVIVHARQEDVDKAMQLVAKLDVPRPLVQIEARIVETSRDTARQLGMEWGGQSSRIRGGRVVNVGGPNGGTAANFPAQFRAGTGEQPAGFTLAGAVFRPGGSELLNVQLTALQESGRLQIKANPTVTTLNNESAVIESGEERAYRVSTGTGNELDVSLEWKKAVLLLEVTPHVIDENLLRVQIVANKDSFDETKPQTNNEFPVNTKRARTTVLLHNGETTMIGGFSMESQSSTSAGVPGLSRLPLLGALFRSRSRANRFDETIIFITPTIL